MTGNNDLALLFLSSLGELLIDFPLAQDFQVRVWFVKKQDGPGVHFQVRK